MIFIPLVLGLGVFIGFKYGSVAAKGELTRLKGELEKHEHDAAAARLERAKKSSSDD